MDSNQKYIFFAGDGVKRRGVFLHFLSKTLLHKIGKMGSFIGFIFIKTQKKVSTIIIFSLLGKLLKKSVFNSLVVEIGRKKI